MYVKYEGITPFGMVQKVDENCKRTGFNMQIDCSDRYLTKAKELDQFFIEAFNLNKWGLNKNIPKSNIESYDEHGQGGLWKRICKASYGVDLKTKEREYLDYPSKMEFSLYFKNDQLETKVFDWKGQPSDYELITPKCKVKFITALFNLTQGTFGLTLKPKLMQIMYKKDTIFTECLFNISDDEETDGEETDGEETESISDELLNKGMCNEWASAIAQCILLPKSYQ